MYLPLVLSDSAPDSIRHLTRHNEESPPVLPLRPLKTLKVHRHFRLHCRIARISHWACPIGALHSTLTAKAAFSFGDRPTSTPIRSSRCSCSILKTTVTQNSDNNLRNT